MKNRQPDYMRADRRLAFTERAMLRLLITGQCLIDSILGGLSLAYIGTASGKGFSVRHELLRGGFD